MREMLAKTVKRKVKFPLFTLCLLFSGFWVLVVSGCNESQQSGGFGVRGGRDNLGAKALQIIEEGLADGNPRVRAKAIEVVAATGRIRLMPKVQRLLKDDFVPVRFAAAVAVGDMEYNLAEEPVKELLNDPDENVRIAAAYALVKVSSMAWLEPLHKAIASKNQTVRANAVLLLGKSGHKRALRLLYRAKDSRDSDAKVRFQAAEAIARLGDEEIYTKLWTMLISKYIENRIMGINAMGALGTRDAKNALITMLDDEVLDVRLSAAEQLGTLGDSTGEPEVLDVFTKNLFAGLDKQGVEQVKVLTALAIGQIGSENLTKFLPQLLRNKSKFVRLAAAEAVFQVQKAN
ncbi:MAG: HEAT repeat domain-containing protein [Planctomycetota bacterium]|jgi:HEAT repeat protein